MKLTLSGTGMLALATLFAGCTPKQENKADAAPMVPVTERSAHFDAVNSHLELGGTLYGYADIDGDVLKIVPYLRTLADTAAVEQPMMAPFLKQDFAQILTDLGFNDIRAIGLSSVPSGSGGFRNRVYLHTPEGRRGLLSVIGGEPTGFANARFAPADADLYAETDLDAAALYAAVKAVVARVAGEPMADVFEAQLQTDSAGLGVTPLGVINSLKGRATLVLRTDAERTFTLPGAEPVVLPAFDFLVRIDGLGASLEPALSQVPLFTASQEGPVKLYSYQGETPFEGLSPVLAVQDGALYVASGAEFLRTSLARTDGLDQVSAFRDALAELGGKGNGVTYVNPRLFEQLRRIKALNPDLPPEGEKTLDFVLGNLPKPTQPLVAVRVNLPEGILYRARWHRSLKQDIAMIGVYNPITVGLFAAMAIPAFHKVTKASKEKAIVNNLRQLSAAADQYMLENGVDEARYDQLVGPGPEHYVRALPSIEGEDYTKIVVRINDTEVRVVTPTGRVVTVPR